MEVFVQLRLDLVENQSIAFGSDINVMHCFTANINSEDDIQSDGNIVNIITDNGLLFSIPVNSIYFIKVTLNND